MHAFASGSRTYKMVTAIIAAYVVCWTPYFIVQFVRLTSLHLCRSPVVRTAHLLTGELGAANSAINVAIYAWMNRDFRYELQLGLPSRRLLNKIC